MIRRNFNKITPAGRERNQQAQEDYDNRIERPLDGLLTDDKEILGENKELRHLLRDRYRHITDFTTKRIEKAEENIDRTSRIEKILEWRDQRTDIKLARLQEKIDHSSNTFLARQLNDRRQWKIKMLGFNKKALAHYSGQLETKRKNKPEELKKKIDGYIRNKVDAMYRKELRKRKNAVSKINHFKRTEFVANMTEDQKNDIMREAIYRVRKNNIEAGRLKDDYSIDDVQDENNVDIRKVTEHYGRIIE